MPKTIAAVTMRLNILPSFAISADAKDGVFERIRARVSAKLKLIWPERSEVVQYIGPDSPNSTNPMKS
jgi:hypothetical protein